MERKTGESRIWVATDGRAGNENAALGLAEAVARRRPIELSVKRLDIHPLAVRLPPRLWGLFGARRGGWPFSMLRGQENLAEPWPDLVIGAGRRSAPFVAAMRRLDAVKAVQILAPQMPLSGFDLVIAPNHDRLKGRNVLSTLGAPHRITPERLAESAARLPALAALPHPRVAVLLGGATKEGAGGFGLGLFTDQLRALADSGARLMITPSRRTPETWMKALRLALPDAWIWDGSGENPYFAMLALADHIIVTGDSVAMASEAASTGKPLYITHLDAPTKKRAAFHASLIAQGAARPFDGVLSKWRYDPLDETARAAEAVAALLENGPRSHT